MNTIADKVGKAKTVDIRHSWWTKTLTMSKATISLRERGNRYLLFDGYFLFMNRILLV